MNALYPDNLRPSAAPDAPLSRADVVLNDQLEAEEIISIPASRLAAAYEVFDNAHAQAIQDGDTVKARVIARVMNQCAAMMEGAL